MRTLENFIDGAFRPAQDGATEAVLNPATGEEIAQSPLSTAADIDVAVGAARRAFETWSQTTPAERATALLKIADVIEEHGEELAREEAINAGKPYLAALSESRNHVCDDSWSAGWALRLGRRRGSRFIFGSGLFCVDVAAQGEWCASAVGRCETGSTIQSFAGLHRTLCWFGTALGAACNSATGSAGRAVRRAAFRDDRVYNRIGRGFDNSIPRL